MADRRLARAELARLVSGQARFWSPQPGPQLLGFYSAADVLLFGGAAGGGKSDLVLGLALESHRRSVIFRREMPQNQANIDRLRGLVNGAGKWNGQTLNWKLGAADRPDRLIAFGSCPHSGDEQRWQGRPFDLVAFDEVTHFSEGQFRYLSAWNRSAVKGQRCRVVATANPPQGSDGRWLIGYFAPWLDDRHPRPASPGELRWFVRRGGEEAEVDGPDPVEWRGERLLPRSRSFIPSRLGDNKYLSASGYEAALQALPEPLRSQLLFGRFGGAVQDDPWQLIPSAWVKAARERWQALPPGPVSSMGVDVARGGRDQTVIMACHGAWVAPAILRAGRDTPDGASVAGLIATVWRPGVTVMVDAIGVGGAVIDALAGLDLPVRPVNGAAKSGARDASGALPFANTRAEAWWRLREALDPAGAAPLALPPDDALADELTAPRWVLKPGGILIEDKDQIRARLGRSPDRADALALAVLPPLVAVPAAVPVIRVL